MTKPQQSFQIEKFTSDDYTAIAAVHNAVYPEFPVTASELARAASDRDERCRCERWMATVGRQVVAHGGFSQSPETFKEGEYTLVGGVVPEYRRRGIGSALFQVVLDRLQTIGATVLRSYAREDRHSNIDFLHQRGFVEYMREQDWELDIAGFNPSPYRELLQRLDREGVRILSLRELDDDPMRDRKLYELVHELMKDTPGAERHQRLPFDQWVDLNFHRPEIPLGGYFVAIDGDDYLGKTHFETEESRHILWTKLTGVVQSHRRRGIASALKVRSIEWARQNGYPKILTDNRSDNVPMLTLNERLGFHRLPPWVFYEKRLAGGTA
jgi:GNAT superfamily N-acetyltransferase